MFYEPAARLEYTAKTKHLSLIYDSLLVMAHTQKKKINKKVKSCWQAHAAIAFGILPANDIYLNLR